jgi:RNA polymerase sigma-70 factor (ECF subfamily)
MDTRRLHDATGTICHAGACRDAQDHASPDSGTTDDHLITRFHHEALPSFEALFGHALRLTRNHHDAEDLYRDTLVKAYAAFHAFSPNTDFKAWACQIMTNTYVKRLPMKAHRA